MCLTVGNNSNKFEIKIYFLKASEEKGRIGIRNPVDISADPDLYQNVTDPEQCLLLL
jgi:hypothetical protein